MQESSDPSLTKSVASEAQCDPANRATSESQNPVPQNIVPANFVEISLMTIPDCSDTEQEDEEVVEDKPDGNANSSGEAHMSSKDAHYEEKPKVTKEEPLPSEITYAEMKRLFDRGAVGEAGKLAYRFSAERHAEDEARAAEERRLAADNSADQDHEEELDADEFAEEEQSWIQSDPIIVKTGGLPAKIAGLTVMEDLIRSGDVIAEVRYIRAEDGVINQFYRRFELRWELRCLYQPLFDSLILPAGVQGFSTTRKLFDSISALLRKHVMLSSKDCALLAYWAIATWFTDYLPFLPSVVVSGPASTADLLLRTLAAVCRRPVLLGELSPAILRKLPINEITPTLLVREPQLSRYMSALLNASNQPGYLFLRGKTFQQLYCPKCIYAGECFKTSPATSNSLHINLGGSAPARRHSLPTKDEITSFQNRLLSYRLLNHDKVATANVHVSELRPEISMVAEVLAAAIVDDLELQKGVIEALEDRDEQSRVDRATGVNGLVLRAVLLHCHQRDQRKFVREIADTANRFYAEDGESLRLSSETVGHVLKDLGLFSRRIGNAGRGLVFDKATQSHAHRLSRAYDLLISESSCEYCHELQQPQAEEVVQEV